MAGEFIGWLVSVSGAMVLFGATALWAWLRPGSTMAHRVLLAVAAGYLLASYYPIPLMAGRLLTIGLPDDLPAQLPPADTTIVLLGGGGGGRVLGKSGQISIEGGGSAARVLEAYRVFTTTNARWLISSGGVAQEGVGLEPSGVRMKNTLVGLGVPESRIIVEAQSRTTHEQAVILTPLLRSLGTRHLVLVTSDTHMPRSLGTFRAQGWNPIPAMAPAPESRERGSHWYWPSERGLQASYAVVHELVGIVAYGARGWFTLRTQDD